jgi:hypothetical protein
MVQTIEMVVTVKAYPSISTKYGETACVAGVRTDTPRPEWVRLYPVVYRDLQYDLRFAKYQRLTLDVTDASDPRPESVKPNLDTLVLGDIISTKHGWRERCALVQPLMVQSMCELRALQQKERRSLGVFRPSRIDDLTVELVDDEWDAGRQGVVDQANLFFPGKSGLEKIPYRFRYLYHCDDAGCPGHEQTIVDWEIAQLYRTLRDKGDTEADVLRKIKDKWLGQMCSAKHDTAFFVGNQFRNPDGFLVLGVFWPPRG